MSINAITAQDLRDSFSEAQRFKELLMDVRSGCSISRSRIENAFNEQWENVGGRGSHRKLVHRVTRQCVEYSNQRRFNTGSIKKIAGAIQEHLNRLGNDIFAFRRENFKSEPNYEKSVERWVEWEKSRKGI